jgi:hypothetical protein
MGDNFIRSSVFFILGTIARVQGAYSGGNYRVVSEMDRREFCFYFLFFLGKKMQFLRIEKNGIFLRNI